MKKRIFSSSTGIFVMIITFFSNAYSFYPAGQAVTYSEFNHINYIAVSNTYAYFATTRGIIRYNKAEKYWEDPLTGTDGVDQTDIKKIWVDDFDSRFYAQTSEGYFEYDIMLEKWYSISYVPEVINQSRHIKLPAVLYAPPLFNYDGYYGHLIDPFGRNFLFEDVVEDLQGNLWIGSWGYGAFSSNTSNYYLNPLPYGLIQDRVNAIYDDDGTLLISGAVLNDQRTGITLYNTNKDEFSFIESGIDNLFPSIDINCLAADEYSIYAGTTNGLFIIDKANKTINQQLTSSNGLAYDNIISLLVNNDTLFIGTEYGLSILYNSDSGMVAIKTSFPEVVIFDMEMVDNSLWLGTSLGAYRLKLKSGKIQKMRDDMAILFSDVIDIERYNQYLWFLSKKGLVKLNIENGEHESFPQVFMSSTANALAVNDTIAAIATENGLAIYFYANKKPFTREFTVDDGLPSNYTYSVMLDGDYLWLGSEMGLTRFYWNNPDRVD
ncbi:MAG: hypothetical protein ABIJ12_02810 [bacterium]